VIAASAATGGGVTAASAEAAKSKASITPSVNLETIAFSPLSRLFVDRPCGEGADLLV
jgi:hypothetical protein